MVQTNVDSMYATADDFYDQMNAAAERERQEKEDLLMLSLNARKSRSSMTKKELEDYDNWLKRYVNRAINKHNYETRYKKNLQRNELANLAGKTKRKKHKKKKHTRKKRKNYKK